MSLQDRLSTFNVLDSQIILDPKSITASEASLNETKRNSANLDLYTDFPIPSPDAESVPVELCDLQVYKRRWYVLFMFALLDSLQAAVWIQWGPLAASTEHAYGWKDDTLALFANWGPITYIPTALFWSWVVDKKGLRVSCVGAAGLMALGTGVRCIFKQPPVFTYMVHLGQVLNGIAGPIAMGAVPKVSAVWFPPGERTTASSLMNVIVGLGITAAFYVGPALVPELEFANCTDHSNTTRDNSSLPTEDEVIEIQRDNVMYYMYGTFAVCAFYFLVMLIYFPSAPPKPPSPSASSRRLKYLKGLKTLAKNGRFWQIAIAYGVSSGTRDAWSSMLDVNLKAHGISQADASYLGIFATVGGIVASLCLARLADKMRTRHRLFLLILYALGGLFYLWLVLLVVEILPHSMVSMYIANGFVDLSNACISPLFYEMVCEATYPVAEGITNISLTTQNNIAALIFLGLFSVPNIGTVWMNWTLIGSYAVAFIMLLFLPSQHHRLDVDIEKAH